MLGAWCSCTQPAFPASAPSNASRPASLAASSATGCLGVDQVRSRCLFVQCSSSVTEGAASHVLAGLQSAGSGGGRNASASANRQGVCVALLSYNSWLNFCSRDAPFPLTAISGCICTLTTVLYIHSGTAAPAGGGLGGGQAAVARASAPVSVTSTNASTSPQRGPGPSPMTGIVAPGGTQVRHTAY
jgi:hypothetical protein